MYQDEIRYYANQTYLNYQKFSMIGQNLNYTYYSNYNCYNPPKVEDYSGYTDSICAKFNSNGQCVLTNDINKFNLFVDNLYQHLSSIDCDDIDSVCRNPFDPSTQNNDKLTPLVDALVYALGVGNVTQNNIDVQVSSGWPKECEDLPIANVRVVCDDNFVSGSFLKVFVYTTILLIYLY
jgi:hypothetical protein